MTWYVDSYQRAQTQGRAYTFDAVEVTQEDVTEDTIPDSIPSMAPVAQMAERRTSIPKVVGSNPTWSEIFGFRSWARN